MAIPGIGVVYVPRRSAQKYQHLMTMSAVVLCALACACLVIYGTDATEIRTEDSSTTSLGAYGTDYKLALAIGGSSAASGSPFKLDPALAAAFAEAKKEQASGLPHSSSSGSGSSGAGSTLQLSDALTKAFKQALNEQQTEKKIEALTKGSKKKAKKL
mmetsp:Transcript_12439/g.28682  ORF Transcript_12439/g.28682 Transcript_12439/m.28682 type:complete len:158 (-) Transcript_12439:107-580(-)